MSENDLCTQYLLLYRVQFQRLRLVSPPLAAVGVGGGVLRLVPFKNQQFACIFPHNKKPTSRIGAAASACRTPRRPGPRPS